MANEKGEKIDVQNENIEKIKRSIKENKEEFIKNVVIYFQNKHGVRFNLDQILEKYKDTRVTYFDITEDIYWQLGGLSFKEKAEQQIKEDVKNDYTLKNIQVIGNKILIKDYINISQDQLTMDSRPKLLEFMRALSNFEDGNIRMSAPFLGVLKAVQGDGKFKPIEIKANKVVVGLCLYKDNRIKIRFATEEKAREFAKEYLGVDEE